jgi:YegS/Rv2252/BmrU family lipid kinase
MKKLVFIINPVAGHGLKKNIEKKIDRFGQSGQFAIEKVYTQYHGHATELSRQVALNHYYAAIAVGGDGTVNQVAAGLLNSRTALGILPVGSGNGFAHTLGIPRSPIHALNIISHSTPVWIDTFTANGRFGINVTGAGFDGYIIHHFSRAGKRGFPTYFRLVLQHYFRFSPQTYQVTIDGNTIERKALLIEVANGPEYGNRVVIAPAARPEDGLLNVVILQKISLFKLPMAAYHLFAGNRLPYPSAEYYSGQHVIIRSSHPLFLHVDGEELSSSLQLDVTINPQSLLVLRA